MAISISGGLLLVLKPKNRNKSAWKPKNRTKVSLKPQTVKTCKTAPNYKK